MHRLWRAGCMRSAWTCSTRSGCATAVMSGGRLPPCATLFVAPAIHSTRSKGCFVANHLLSSAQRILPHSGRGFSRIECECALMKKKLQTAYNRSAVIRVDSRRSTTLVLRSQPNDVTLPSAQSMLLTAYDHSAKICLSFAKIYKRLLRSVNERLDP